MTEKALEARQDALSVSQSDELQPEDVCPALSRDWACGLQKGHTGPCQDAEPAWFRAWQRSKAIQRDIREQERQKARLTSTEAQRLRD